MKSEILNEVLNKICSIYLKSFGGNSYTGKVVGIDDHWLKLQIKNNVNLIHLDNITSIEILPEKYQH